MMTHLDGSGRGVAQILPNILSWTRLAAAPVTAWCILSGEWLAAAILFPLAAVSDALDGFVARRFGTVTAFGRLIDPLADKCLMAATYASLSATGHLPWWLTALVFARDLTIVSVYVSSRLGGRPVPVAPSWTGKTSTLVQALTAAVAVASAAHLLPVDGVPVPLVWTAAAATVVSGLHYLVRWLRGSGAGPRSAAL